MTPLPIDPELPDLVGALERHSSLVLVAEPGAGKTTRVPPALLDASFAAGREVLVTAPRRLAVRLAARRVAEERGERLGDRVGYRIRFEEAAGPATRLVYLTEGVLLRRLATDPALDGVAAVVLDEFHERTLDADLALALLRRLQRGARPDLRLVAMSATLAAEPVAAFLDAPVHRVAGRPFPVAVEHLSRPDPRPLAQQVASAVRAAVEGEGGPDGRGAAGSGDRRGAGEGRGDILVFLPGAAEIRRAREACTGLAAAHDLEIVPLHGDLPSAEQDRAVRPAPRRKLILSTNVAETSVTIDGVTVVIDSGLARVAGHSPWSGLPTLATRPISRASAAQRAGRAGRTAPGRCLHLFTRHDHDTRPAFDEPAVRREDLAGSLLLLHALGVRDAAAFEWFETPRPAALEAGERLLVDLGATALGGELTATGRALLRYPLHPRAARLLDEAARRGAARRGALFAALLGEREVRLAARTRFGDGTARGDGGGSAGPGGGAGPAGPSDLLAQLDAVEEATRDVHSPERLRARGLDPAATLAVLRARDQLLRLTRRAADPPLDPESEERVLLEATLAAFPDRVARRREPGRPALVFARGGAGELAPSSVVRSAEFLVAVDADDRRERGVAVRLASAIDPAWLIDLFPGRLEDRTETVFQAASGRVERISALHFEGLTLDASRVPAPADDETAEVLHRAVRELGLGAVLDLEELARWQQRIAFAAEHQAGLPRLDEAALDAALRAACAGRRSLDELRESALLAGWLAGLAPAQRAAVERLAPERVTLPGGRRVAVHYEPGKPPWIASRLQDFFGMGEGPRAADGRVPLVLHLLAPNQRPVQVTTDLAGFWERHYPALRRELMRRYPRHAWPDDPRTASPPPSGTGGRRNTR
ncbi:MAG: ATP-dependent helicase HrpB [Acidobacteria bacterium]|nr:ATP-dependent helicase HrpB [Acidobacteriota bacterium]